MPLQLLYGDNQLEIEQAIRAVTTTFASTDAIAFDGATAPLADIREACLTVGLFDPDRLVVVRGLHERIKGTRKENSDLEEIQRLLGSLPPTTTLILASPGMPAEHQLVSAVRSVGGAVKTYLMPKRNDLPRWIVERGRARGAEVDRDAADLLAELVGGNPVLLDNELEKLATYAGGSRVTPEMVDTLVGAVTQESIFTLIDAIAAGSKGRALLLLHAQMDQAGDKPIEFTLQLIRLLARQIRILLRIHLGQEKGRSLAQIVAELKIPRYYSDRYARQAKRLSKQRLCEAFEHLAALEQGLKSGTAEPATGLDLLVSELCS